MSFSTSTASPPISPSPIDGWRSAFTTGSISSAARITAGWTIGVMTAAMYQVAYEEGRTWVRGLRDGRAQRRTRNDIVMCALLQTDLPLPALVEFRKERDIFRAVIDRSVDPLVPPGVRETLRKMLLGLMRAEQVSA